MAEVQGIITTEAAAAAAAASVSTVDDELTAQSASGEREREREGGKERLNVVHYRFEMTLQMCLLHLIKLSSSML